MGWQGMQVATQSLVVNTVFAPAAHMLPMQNQTTALRLPPVPAPLNAHPAKPPAQQVSFQTLDVQVAGPPFGYQPLPMPIPPRAPAPGPVHPFPNAVMQAVPETPYGKATKCPTNAPSTPSTLSAISTTINSRTPSTATGDATVDPSCF